ncbi:hypothetical protein NUU61_002341 [Penicillium alfredii]|uniref:Uncharacterized protein n=1 Tax=Penicillium alfredii TaxID=1506179 RepID=A0A9W9FRD6_9EURO|nr:uncharacterized protein NUU61_002341 [Penicillium alfredii]KAJ5104994.1 hypothetical protein NUU61_002341 [Penicillium alfredii]
MVRSSIDGNPLDPTSMDHRTSLEGHHQSQAETQNPKDSHDLVDRNVAPSPQATCAELAHQHALEDLQKSNEHWLGQDQLAESAILPTPNMDRSTRFNLRKPDE